ncbi:MAG: divalent-cation tolerance protein CutA [Candidatus Dadabacteria bacterium]|nr:MAG: divalent-cation tolerance protein CutA [Candidatus Dadabacteria bacterium]
MNTEVFLVTVPDIQTAKNIATTLLNEKLIACANIVPAIESLYIWQGKLENHQEALMIIKSSYSLLRKLEKRLAELHPYDTPEIIAVAPERVFKPYEKWVIESVAGSKKRVKDS